MSWYAELRVLNLSLVNAGHYDGEDAANAGMSNADVDFDEHNRIQARGWQHGGGGEPFHGFSQSPLDDLVQRPSELDRLLR